MGDTFYNPEKLYNRVFIRTLIRNAPKDIKRIGENLPEFECVDKEGNSLICVKIPEVIFIYMKGRY